MRRKEREVSDLSAIEEIIARCKICRIGLSENDIPYIVPLNFGYMKGRPSCFYFHCANTGRKIDMIAQNNKVCFEMDTDHKLTDGDAACDFSMLYTSVMGSGKIYIVTEEEERNSGLNCLMKQYTGKDNYSFKPSTMGRTTILRLEIGEISAKQVK
jgi:nitroimidazol reductase NimA-like FMN-containing flavoprotein (pyridoxamine 5'-phosphate oxidase superfamily)